MGRIVILPDAVVNRIAAGEVVHRPASVVKELIDNALDAGARRLEIHLEQGGRRSIRVRDDGHGMDAEDAVLAFERHATSKVRTVDDLGRIETLGFRGEALASIAAVSHVILETRPADAEVGTQVEVVGGRLRRVTSIAMPPGTTVWVRHLFMNVPARRKFLGSASVELAHVMDVVENYALAYPDVTFHVWHNGREVVLYPAVSEPLARIQQVFGVETAHALLPIHFETPSGSLMGWISSPDRGSHRPRDLHVFVNRRVVRDRWLFQTFREGWQKYGARRPYPLLVAFLTWPSTMVDVNVHPTKAEVRFRDPHHVQELIWTAIDQVMQTTRPVEVWKPPPPPPRPSVSATPSRVAPLCAPPQPGTDPPSPTVEAVLGQWAGCYIVVLEPEAILLLDQHLVHERYLYEQWCNSGEHLPTQSLLAPMPVEVGPSVASTLQAHRATLETLGWSVALFGSGAVVVHRIPLGIDDIHVPEALRALSEILTGPKAAAEPAWDELLKTMACRAAVKKGETLSRERLETLVNLWRRLKVPQVCPHGRRMAIRIPLDRIHRQFGRTWHGESEG